MTDAREIIAQEFRLAHRDTCYPDASTGECEIAASVIVSSLNAAGFRIIGPDGVDPVTLDKAADYIEGAGGVIPGTVGFATLVSGNRQPCMSGDGRDRLHPHVRRGFDDATASLAAAIRALCATHQGDK